MDDRFDAILGGFAETNSEDETTVETTAPETVETVEEAVTPTEETATETVTEEATATTETQTEAQPRDNKGQYASPKTWVPVEVAQAARQKAQAEAQRATELEARIRELEEAQRQATVAPDLFENPEDYRAHLIEEAKREARAEVLQQEAHRQQAAQQQQLEQLTSHFERTILNHPIEKVQEAVEYAQDLGDPDWSLAMLNADDPVIWALEEKNRHAQQRAEWEDYQRNPQEFFAKRAATMSAAAVPVTAATANPQAATAKATRSLAGAGATAAPTTPTLSRAEAFDAFLENKR
jgi:hypothetical protein